MRALGRSVYIGYAVTKGCVCPGGSDNNVFILKNILNNSKYKIAKQVKEGVPCEGDARSNREPIAIHISCSIKGKKFYLPALPEGEKFFF